MADEKTKENGAAEEPQAPIINVVNQYIRDLSFENIAAQKRMGGQVQPEINVQVNLDAAKHGEDQYEVVLKLTVKAVQKEDVVFLMEVDYAGLFMIKNVPDEQLHPFLLIECPRTLFPFVRRIVRDTTADAGYPPLNVDTIDFVSLYRSEIERRAAAEQAKVN